MKPKVQEGLLCIFYRTNLRVPTPCRKWRQQSSAQVAPWWHVVGVYQRFRPILIIIGQIEFLQIEFSTLINNLNEFRERTSRPRQREDFLKIFLGKFK